MGMAEQLSKEEANRRLLAAVEACKRSEEEDEWIRWRHATDEERYAEFVRLQRLAEQATSDTVASFEEDPTPFPRWRLRKKS